MSERSYSSIALTAGGAILAGLGIYFVALRPPLLPEDPRFMGASLEAIQAAVPGLATWLRGVFWVMGGFMFSAGVLTIYLARTSFRTRARGAAAIAAVTGATSIGWMVAVNFMIASDFRWLLLAFTVPWVIALALYWREGAKAVSAPARA